MPKHEQPRLPPGNWEKPTKQKLKDALGQDMEEPLSGRVIVAFHDKWKEATKGLYRVSADRRELVFDVEFEDGGQLTFYNLGACRIEKKVERE